MKTCSVLPHTHAHQPHTCPGARKTPVAVQPPAHPPCIHPAAAARLDNSLFSPMRSLLKLHQWQQQSIRHEYPVMSDAWYMVGSLDAHLGGKQEFGNVGNTSRQCFPAPFLGHEAGLCPTPSLCVCVRGCCPPNVLGKLKCSRESIPLHTAKGLGIKIPGEVHPAFIATLKS